MLSTAIFVYAATSPVNGYFGGSLYAKQGGNKNVCSSHSVWLLSCTLLLSHRLNRSRHAVLWFVPITQAEDGLNKCSLEPSWSLPWFVELPSSSTSSPSTTTPPELSHLAPWWVWHSDTSLKTTVMRRIFWVNRLHFICVALLRCGRTGVI